MATVEMRDGEPSVVRIEGEMTIYQAEQLKRTLLDALDRTSVLEVNLAAVTELDTAGVQLLMLAKKTARDRQKELRLVAHSEAVVEVFELIDLGPYFGDPLVISPPASHAAERAANLSAGHSNES